MVVNYEIKNEVANENYTEMVDVGYELVSNTKTYKHYSYSF